MERECTPARSFQTSGRDLLRSKISGQGFPVSPPFLHRRHLRRFVPGGFSRGFTLSRNQFSSSGSLWLSIPRLLSFLTLVGFPLWEKAYLQVTAAKREKFSFDVPDQKKGNPGTLERNTCPIRSTSEHPRSSKFRTTRNQNQISAPYAKNQTRKPMNPERQKRAHGEHS